MSLETTILVVDDEIEMRIALQKSLEKCGYKAHIDRYDYAQTKWYGNS